MLKYHRNRKRILLAGLIFIMMFSVMTVSASAAWKKNSNGTYSYYNDKGKLLKNKWINKTYYVNSKGVRQTGWLHKGGKWYYFTKAGKVVKNKWIKSSKKMYYAGGSGALLVNGRHKIGDGYYAFNNRGVMLTGNRKYNGKYYFFGTKTGKMLTKTWVSINKKKYYYGADGARVYNSWVGRYYVGSNGTRLVNSWKNNKYLGSDGKAVSGLKKIGSDYYYFDSKTYVKVTNATVKVDGKTYKFDSTGKGKETSSTKIPATNVSVENTYKTDPYATDEKLLASIIYCESGNQPYEGKLAVGMVVMNRVHHYSYTVREIIYQKSQFTPARNGSLTKALKNYNTLVNEESKKAAAEVLDMYKGHKKGDKVYLMLDDEKIEFPHMFFMTPAAYNSLGLSAKTLKIKDHVFFKTWK